MKSIEIEIKLLENEKKRKEKLLDNYRRFGDFYFLEQAKESADKIEKIKARLKRSGETKAKPKKERKERPSLDRAIKESLIEMTAYEMGIEHVLICAGTSPTTATAIIDEIIESEFSADHKLMMIKMFLDNQMSSLEIDGLLHDEMIIIPRKRVE